MQTPLQSPPRSSSQPEGEHIKKDKGKKVKKLKKFDFVTEYGRHIHFSKEKINNQKKLEEEAKAEAAKQEREDPLDKLNDLANKKIKHADDIHDYFKATKRLKSSFCMEIHISWISQMSIAITPYKESSSTTS
ncbi:hypothetical protein Tco_0781647 [Tanacetum coccineum]